MRRGRPESATPKKATNLRLDPDVLDHYRATGAGVTVAHQSNPNKYTVIVIPSYLANSGCKRTMQVAEARADIRSIPHEEVRAWLLEVSAGNFDARKPKPR